MNSRRARRAFTLIEVLAALAITAILIGAIGQVVRASVRSIGAVDAAAVRRSEIDRAAALVASLDRLAPGVSERGGFRVSVQPAPFARAAALRRDGYVLYDVTVLSAREDRAVYVGVRLAKP
jgi:prepilin-type N-terminal cleavage/methylation domain-containing protein